MITIDGVMLNVDKELVKKYQKLTGDADELLLEIFKHMLRNQLAVILRLELVLVSFKIGVNIFAFYVHSVAPLTFFSFGTHIIS